MLENGFFFIFATIIIVTQVFIYIKMSRLKQNIKPSGEGKFTKGSWIYLAGILILTILIFSNSVKNNFIYQLDDDVYITSCNDIKAFTADNIHAIFTTAYAGLYLPLTMLTYMIEYHFFGLNPKAYHMVNLLLHLINIVLVFLLIYKLKPKPLVAGVVAIFFAIHPMHVEAVSWLSERKDLLFSMFYLLGLNTYVVFARKRQWKHYVITLLLFIFSLLSKPLAISFPLFLVLIDWYHERKFTLRVISEKVPFFALSLIFGLIGIYFGKTLNPQDLITPEFDWFYRVFIVSNAILFYLFKLIAPFGLSVYHYYPKIINGNLPFEFYISAPLILLIISGVAWFLVYKANGLRKDIIMGLAFFIIPTAFVLQLVPIGRAYAAERYTYLSYIGLFFILSLFVDRILNGTNINKNLKRLSGGLLIAVILGFSYLTYQRNKDWMDSLTMFTDLIDKNPVRGHPYLCRGITKYQFGDNIGALEDYNLSIKYDTNDAKAYSNRSSVRGILKDYNGALEDCNKALIIQPGYINALNNRATAKLFLNDLQGAFEDYTASVRLDSLNPKSYRNRIGISEKLGNMDAMLSDYAMLIKLEPSSAANLAGRGEIYYKNGNFDLAISDLSKALQLNPSLYGAFFARGNAYFGIGKYELAVSDFSKLIQHSPNDAPAYYNRGICYLKLNEMENACHDWEQARKNGNPDAIQKINRYCK